MSSTTSKQPYLIRALYEWIADNTMTPYIIVDANTYNVMVPQQYVTDGLITLNISMNSVRELEITNEAIMFSAMFMGVKENIYIPIEAVRAIYAKENGDGMVFNTETQSQSTTAPTTSGQNTQVPPKRQKPVLRIVK